MNKPKRSYKKTRLLSQLDAPGSPVFLLDRSRNIQFVNTGVTELFGCAAEDLLQQQCHYQSVANEHDNQAILTCLCPPAEVFSGKSQKVPVYIPQKNKHPFARLIHFFPLHDHAGTVEHVLGIIAALEEPEKKTVGSPAQQLHAELAALRLTIRNNYGLEKLIANSAAMQRVLMQIQLAIKTTSSIFLDGEPGVGKEHIARIIHQKSPFAQRAFIPINCKLLPAVELISTLRRALDMHPAAAEPPTALQPGTIYLKHVSSMPRDVQDWLANHWPKHDQIRIISSELTDLEIARSEELIRDDLYYLLTPLAIKIPPLRERREDLPLMAQDFLELGNPESDPQVTGFAEAVWNLFYEYDWPGNLDELADIVREARTTCQDYTIQTEDLPFRFRAGLQKQSENPTSKTDLQPLDHMLAKVEADHIQQALEICQYNKALAAELLGMTRAKLYRRMEHLHIPNSPEGRT